MGQNVTYIWQGKETQGSSKTLQLVKEKGGSGLPSFRDYYFAMRAMTCWWNPSYIAQWKGIGERVSSIPHKQKD